MKIHSTARQLGARIEGVDLAQPVSDGDFKQILRALGEHGVLCFPGQRLETAQFARFGRMFGELEINVANQFHEPGFPEVMVLSNMTGDGKPVGLGDAGQGWHTDMSYSRRSRSPTCSMPSRCRCATAGRWATPSSATCTRPMRTCRPTSRRGSKGARPRTTSPSSGT